ncbi:Gfo/Idh/MocA family oxidoreductase [Sinomonas notoginsengisoli]|uniref:Gfo/Idh/MocA family protein n=1 Tax=Sinomonas notoginsengisoli TaxID=1457311 RepID=UPI001F3D5691|nr:Gfo/Idh/MocA family oxidoreductase [Sinomonas notoginsengisoli]
MTAVRWGVLTTARIAQHRFLPAAAKAENAVVGAISSPSGRAEEVARRFGIPKSYRSHEELLADPDIDAVYLPFPNSLHADWAVRSAEAGKHVLCEKPLVASTEDLQRVLSAADEAGVRIMEAFMYRFHPHQGRARELIAAGRIGQIVSVHARFHFVMDRQPQEPRLLPGMDGGALNDVGTYGVDALNSVVGRLPGTVYGRGTSWTDPVDTTMAAILDYDGILGTIDCGFEGPRSRSHTLQIIGTDGAITLDKAFDPDPDETATLTLSTRAGETQTFPLVHDSFRTEIEAFGDLIRTPGPVMPFRELTEQNLIVRNALHESMVTGLPQQLALASPLNVQ